MRAIIFLAIAMVLAAPGLSSAQCREASTVAGGVGGALIGNQVAKNNCGHARRVSCHWETHYRHHHSYRVQVCTR